MTTTETSYLRLFSHDASDEPDGLVRGVSRPVSVSTVPRKSHKREPHPGLKSAMIIRTGARAIGCHAAAIYLLDDATTQLETHGAWGLPFSRADRAPRPLKGAVADLEAMLGHAVIVDSHTAASWNPPEKFPSAVCVPISSPTTILGTLWFFSKRPRDFTSRDTDLAELTAGRIAADLERHALLAEAAAGRQWQAELTVARRQQRTQLPTIAPLLDGWELAGWSSSGEPLSGAFFDWFCLPDGLVALSAGQVPGPALAAALGAGALRMALRCHAQHRPDPGQILSLANLSLWTASAGDQSASVCAGLLQPDAGRFRYAWAGGTRVLRVTPTGCHTLAKPGLPLGADPEVRFPHAEIQLSPGEALLLLTEPRAEASLFDDRADAEAHLIQSLTRHSASPAKELAAIAKEAFVDPAATPSTEGFAGVVVKRCTA